MSERIKLENPGDELTLTIGSIGSEEVGGYDYWLVTGDGKEFLVPQKSIASQLDRVGAGDVMGMVGKTVKFSRSEKVNKFNKPYWNLDLVNGKPPVAKNKVPIPSHSNVPDAELPEFLRNAEPEDNAALDAKVGVDLTAIERKLAVYLGITEWYLEKIPPLYEKAKIGCSPESAAAGIHTLFITAHR